MTTWIKSTLLCGLSAILISFTVSSKSLFASSNQLNIQFPDSSETVSIPEDTLHWAIFGRGKISEFLGRKAVLMEAGSAVLKNIKMRDAVIDVDVATPAKRGFFGVEFRMSGLNSEWIYLRQHKSGQADAIQYTPVLNTGLNWQIYNGEGFTGPVDIPLNEWIHMRIVVAGAQAKFYVKDMNMPVLVMDDLKTGIREGEIALSVLIGATYFSNFKITKTPDVPWVRHEPAIPAGTITKWKISPSYDALARNLERTLTKTERDTIKWEDVEAEPPGHVVLYRKFMAPHLRVTFANDFSKKMEPQPGTKVVYAIANINSEKDQIKKLELGYSDEVSVILNGKILFRGRSAQNFRDPGFLGIMNPENDALYLPLKKGNNELMLVLSEIGGGWGFICRLQNFEN